MANESTQPPSEDVEALVRRLHKEHSPRGGPYVLEDALRSAILAGRRLGIEQAVEAADAAPITPMSAHRTADDIIDAIRALLKEIDR